MEFDAHHVQKTMSDNAQLNLSIMDTAGHKECERLRPIHYIDADVVLVCFAVDEPEAGYHNVSSVWAREVQHFCPGVPVVLVATKIGVCVSVCVFPILSLILWACLGVISLCAHVPACLSCSLALTLCVCLCPSRTPHVPILCVQMLVTPSFLPSFPPPL